MNNAEIGKAMVIKLDPVLPEYPTFKEGVRRAPKRELTLNKREIKLAVANALRYVPEELHEQLAPEFLDELLTRGRIYGYRLCRRREFTENLLMSTKASALKEKPSR